MNLPYFYEEKIQQPIHILSEETARHCIQVLRMKEGEQLQLTDGKGSLFTASITKENKKNCEVKIEAMSYELRAASHVAIAISLLKNPSRLEWFMEKATEIGVSEIIPLICDHTKNKIFVTTGCKTFLFQQCCKANKPGCRNCISQKIQRFHNEDFDGLKLIAHCAEEEKHSLSELMNEHKDQKNLYLSGPRRFFKCRDHGCTGKKIYTCFIGHYKIANRNCRHCCGDFVMQYSLNSIIMRSSNNCRA
jgi:16S rRNA (uracil1498-N3)-methyltransferase